MTGSWKPSKWRKSPNLVLLSKFAATWYIIFHVLRMVSDNIFPILEDQTFNYKWNSIKICLWTFTYLFVGNNFLVISIHNTTKSNFQKESFSFSQNFQISLRFTITNPPPLRYTDDPLFFETRKFSLRKFFYKQIPLFFTKNSRRG